MTTPLDVPSLIGAIDADASAPVPDDQLDEA